MGWLSNAWNSVKAGVKETIRTGSITSGVKKTISTYSELSHKETKIINERRRKEEDDREYERRREQEERERQAELAAQRERDEAARKRLIAKRQKMIDSFQENNVAGAEIYESNARRVYEETYEGFLNEVEKIMDVNPIRNFIVEKSKSFKDIMRNEVNRKISLGSQEMLRIMDDETLSLEEYEKKLNSYVDTVCDNARKKLLDKIQEAVNETNEYIRANANAFLNNELEFVKEQNNTLKELSKQGAARDAQILTIAEQRATLQMINSIANEIS